MENYIILIILLFLSALFSGLTLGIMGLNLSELKRKVNLGDKNAIKVLSVRKNGSLLLCSLLLANTAINSAISVFMTSIASGIVAGTVSTISIVLIGEIAPQAIFSRHALRFGAKMTWFMKVVMFVMYPFAKPVAMLIDKVFGKEPLTTWDKKEIAEIIKTHEGESIDADENRIIMGALSFSDKTAKSVMTPRTVIFGLERNQIVDADLLKQIREEGYSRIPIYTDVKDHVVGILYAKKLIGSEYVGYKIDDLCNKENILSYRDDAKLDMILSSLIKTRSHMSFIFDEYGTLKGIVTMEDIVEEILKTEIMDESDDIADLQISAKEKIKKKLTKQHE